MVNVVSKKCHMYMTQHSNMFYMLQFQFANKSLCNFIYTVHVRVHVRHIRVCDLKSLNMTFKVSPEITYDTQLTHYSVKRLED